MTASLDRAAFFARVRASVLFGGHLTQSQVDGFGALLDAAPSDMAAEPLAYVLATAYHETARTLQPIEEIGRGKGKSYGIPDPATGQAYFGRGYVQLTWRTGYAKAEKELGRPFVNRPDLALQPDLAAAILYRGMAEGWFTGKKLADYFGHGKADPVGARRIVNGTDKAAQIASYYKVFLSALQAGGHRAKPAAPAPASSGSPPANAAPSPAPTGWRRLLAWLRS
jgi:putative chitinase